MKIAILGGTGRQGLALARRWAQVGHEIILGSRTPEKAEEAAAALNAAIGNGSNVIGSGNVDAAEACEVAVLAVPYSAQRSVLELLKEQLAGKLLVSVVAPLQPHRIGCVWHPAGGSAAQEAQSLLGEATPVVIAFQNVSAHYLAYPNDRIDADILICGDKTEHKSIAAQLVCDAGLRGLDAGPLVNAGIVEGLTAVLLGINNHYKVKGAGIRITGLPDESEAR